MTDSVVFCYGRMNPVTKGHERLIKKVLSTAKKLDADYEVFLSKKTNTDSDLLTFTEKQLVLTSLFKDLKINTDEKIKTPFQALEHLSKKYKNIYLVVGSDRVEEFKQNMSNYVYEWGAENFEIILCGKRDNSSLISGISSTLLRRAILENNINLAHSMMPTKLKIDTKNWICNVIKERRHANRK